MSSKLGHTQKQKPLHLQFMAYFASTPFLKMKRAKAKVQMRQRVKLAMLAGKHKPRWN